MELKAVGCGMRMQAVFWSSEKIVGIMVHGAVCVEGEDQENEAWRLERGEEGECTIFKQ